MGQYICTECGNIYDTKPDYCDCGNDIFDIIGDPEPDDVIPPRPTPAASNIEFQQDYQVLDDTEEISYEVNYNRNVDYTPVPAKKDLSFLGIIISIFLALIILFFPVENNSQNTKTEKAKQSVKKNIAIPHIDKIWDSTPPKYQQTQVRTPQPPVVNVVAPQPKTQPQAAPVSVAKKVTPTKTIQKQQTPKPAPQPKVVKKTTTPTAKKQTTTAKAPQKATQTASKKSTPLPVKKETKAQQPQKVQTQKNTEAHEKAKKEAELKAKKQAELKAQRAELISYKTALRQALFRNLSVKSIEGAGTCGIQFKVDSTGKLTNRAFTFQSNNKSVNDEVYKMMMKTPRFTPPPSGYNGETIKLNLQFDNGSYSIYFVN